MLLSTVPSGGWSNFFQMIGWIILPVMGVAIITTIYLHYRRRRKAPKELLDLPLHEASPELVGYTRGNGEYILFDHSRLIAEYKKQISCQLAKNAALQADIRKLEAQVKLKGDQSHENTRQEILMESLGDSHQMIALLQKQLEQSQARNQLLEEQIRSNRDNLRQLYREFSSSLQAGDTSPVIPIAGSLSTDKVDVSVS